MYQITYEHCDQSWTDTWECACNDRCPVCNQEIEPSRVEYIGEEEATEPACQYAC